VLAACGLDPDGHPSPDTLRAMQDRMHQRYGGVRRIEQAIVASDLASVRSAAHSIAALDEPDALPRWESYFDAVRDAARELEAADDTVAAGRRAAELGRQCAHCHQAIGAHIAFRTEPKPDAGEKLRDTMAAHQWAVARMWEGLLAPSDERWAKGAELLAKAPLAITAESSSLGIADDVARIHALAARARKPATLDERADLFGQLLATCARCHATIRDR
jgi:cytochrome c553